MWITLLNLAGEVPLCDYTIGGKFISAVIGVFAVSLFSIPVGVLGSGFQAWVTEAAEQAAEKKAVSAVGSEYPGEDDRPESPQRYSRCSSRGGSDEMIETSPLLGKPSKLDHCVIVWALTVAHWRCSSSSHPLTPTTPSVSNFCTSPHPPPPPLPHFILLSDVSAAPSEQDTDLLLNDTEPPTLRLKAFHLVTGKYLSGRCFTLVIFVLILLVTVEAMLTTVASLSGHNTYFDWCVVGSVMTGTGVVGRRYCCGGGHGGYAVVGSRLGYVTRLWELHLACDDVVPHPWSFPRFEGAVVVIFTVEYLLRLYAAPEDPRFHEHTWMSRYLGISSISKRLQFVVSGIQVICLRSCYLWLRSRHCKTAAFATASTATDTFAHQSQHLACIGGVYMCACLLQTTLFSVVDLLAIVPWYMAKGGLDLADSADEILRQIRMLRLLSMDR